MYRLFILCCLFLLSVLCTDIFGQVLGPELKAKQISFGFAAEKYKRKLDPNYKDGNSWGVPAVYVAAAISGRISICAEGFILHLKDSQRPVRDYYGYSIGAGITGRLLSINACRVIGTIHYSNTFWFDRSRERYHKNPRSFIGVLQLARTMNISSREVTLLLGPAYVYDELIEYPYGTWHPLTSKSFNNIGGVASVNVVLLKCINYTLSVVYADYFQPRFGLGVLL